MPKTLLLADDSVVIQKLVGLSFANEDVEILTVDNGDDAVARALEAKPDLVLADVVMPGLSGYEVCDAIKRNPELSGIPVLLLTGTFEAFDEERAREVGASGHITKPFEAQALVERVNELFAAAAAASPPAPTAAPRSNDFFDENIGDLAGAPEATPLDSDSANDDFAFGSSSDEPLSAESDFMTNESMDLGGGDAGLGALLEGAEAGDRTIAMMPDTDEPLAARTDDLLAPSTTSTMPPAQPLGRPATAPAVDDSPLLSDDDLISDLDDDVSADLLEDEGFGRPTPPPVPVAPAPAAPAPARETAAPPAIPSLGDTDPLADSTPSVSSDPLAGFEPPKAPPQAEPRKPAPDASQSLDLDDLSFGSQPTHPPSLSPDAQPGETVLASDLFSDGASLDTSSSSAAAAPARSSSGLDFDFGGPLDRASASSESIASEYDVSSSEIAVDPHEPVAASPIERAPEPPALDTAVAPDPIVDSGVSASTVEPPAEEEPSEEPMVGGEMIVDAEPSREAPRPAFASEPEPIVANQAATDHSGIGFADAKTAGPDLSKVMQDRVHDTLEKVAWEAFSDLSDTIVKQILERVEQIAWEVIPQMTETLVREEIRKMKDDEQE